MFQATRRRLALWYAIVTAILLVFFAASVYLYVRVTLVDRVDDTLKHVIEVVERSLVLEASQSDETPQTVTINLAASFRWSETTRNFNEDRIDLEWFSPTGDLLWTTWDRSLNIPLNFSPSGHTVLVSSPTAETNISTELGTELSTERSTKNSSETGTRKGHDTRTAIDIDMDTISDAGTDLGREISINTAIPSPAQPLRQITKLIKHDRQPLGYLRVSHPWFEVTKPSQDLMVDLSFGIICIVVTISAIGWWLSGLAIRPVLDSYERLRQFTADASHELRSPISSIQTNIQVALREPDAMRIRDRLSLMERTTRRLSQLVDDLLFLARQDSPMGETEFEPIPLDALLLETVEEQQAIATEKQLSLHLDIHNSCVRPPSSHDAATAELDPDLEPYTIDGDWNQLARLFTNLLSNAIRYTPEHGQIYVTLRDRQDGMERQTIVEIRDTGIGIAPENLTRIFERFYRIDTARYRQLGSEHGSGLGLSIVKAIADRHAAHVSIESQSDHGTTVTTRFKNRG